MILFRKSVGKTAKDEYWSKHPWSQHRVYVSPCALVWTMGMYQSIHCLVIERMLIYITLCFDVKWNEGYKRKIRTENQTRKKAKIKQKRPFGWTVCYKRGTTEITSTLRLLPWLFKHLLAATLIINTAVFAKTLSAWRETPTHQLLRQCKPVIASQTGKRKREWEK